MNYLTFEEYQTKGGTLDLTAFNRNIDHACLMIDNRTQSRLLSFSEIPDVVKIACRDLVEYIAANTVEKAVTSRSQSANGVSESESYAIKTAEDYASDLDRIFDLLAEVKTLNGISILYRGAMS